MKRLGFRVDFAKMPKTDINVNIRLGDDVKIDNSNIDSWHFGGLLDIYPFGNTWF